MAGYGVATMLGRAGKPPIESIAWGAAAGCFAASMFGLLYDRSAVPEFRRSYRVLTRHLASGQWTAEYDRRERLAMFGIPVAFATFIIPVVTAFWWFIAWKGGVWSLSMQWFAAYFFAGVAGAALTMIIGRATTDHRLLQREIAFNTTPLATDAQRAAAPVAAAATLNPPPTEAELDALRSRGRRDAVIVMTGGALLLGLNHYMAVTQGRYYPKLVLAGPLFLVVGLFGLFEPRIMTRHLPVGKHYPGTVLMWMLLALAVGAAVSWPIYNWYHG